MDGKILTFDGADYTKVTKKKRTELRDGNLIGFCPNYKQIVLSRELLNKAGAKNAITANLYFNTKYKTLGIEFFKDARGEFNICNGRIRSKALFQALAEDGLGYPMSVGKDKISFDYANIRLELRLK